ncbi:MAG: Teichoic acids export ATP-binding protein TagH [candidate division BRC1 bacterium ADurb.BinA364]|nr:MAG: Teichoic acids export ATP-binding protein TagH [candidate division BRC1 bacterium ADurb.BinA364]
MRSEEPYLRLENVSKRYALRRPRLFRRALGGWAARAQGPGAQAPLGEVWALRGIDIELGPGRALGVIGMNGSGKSTLLKILAGVSAPTGGRVDRRGSLVGLLELGAGFHPDLTGYQNVYLQGNLMGLRKAEIEARIPAIVEFAGLEKFMDWPVKRYSTGMHARLGFSIALHAGARAILIDEILTVGDMEFQQRGLARMRQIRDAGDSILVLVTHDIEMARTFCDELIWLDGGAIQERGDPDTVAAAYLRRVVPMNLRSLGYSSDLDLAAEAERRLAADSPLRIERVWFRGPGGEAIEETRTGEPFELVVETRAERDLEGLDFAAFFVHEDGLPFLEARSSRLGRPLDLKRGRNEIVTRFDPNILYERVLSATTLIAEDASRERYFAVARRAGPLRIRPSNPYPIWHAIEHPREWIARPE